MWRTTTPPLYLLVWILLLTLFPQATTRAASLESATSRAWDQYIEFAKSRMNRRLSPGESFLWLDEAQDRLARVRAGEIVVAPFNPQNPVRVQSGLIHHWVGAVFIPGATLKGAVQVLRDYSRYKDWYQPAVIDSRVIANGEAADRFSMLLLNKTFFSKTAFDTNYESCFIRVDDSRAYSVSRTTRVQEIAEYGGPGQHFLPEGDGSGLIWRLFSITRYVERDGGVYFEIEAIGLSRDIPSALRWLVEPIVRRVSRESLSTSLRQTESAVQPHVELANRTPGGESSRGAVAYDAHPPMLPMPVKTQAQLGLITP